MNLCCYFYINLLYKLQAKVGPEELKHVPFLEYTNIQLCQTAI